jgi:hypothetical protein
MKVEELEIGCLYQIKDTEDRWFAIVGGKLDIWCATTAGPRFFLYLGEKKNKWRKYERMVLWNGKILPIWNNSWKHIEKCS